MDAAAAVDEAQEVVEAFLAGAGPERRVGQLGLVAEGVEADAAALLGDPHVAGLVGVDAVVDVPEQDAVEGQPLLLEDRDGVLGVDREVGEDGDARGEGGVGGGPVDPLVEVGHPAAPAHADLDDAA